MANINRFAIPQRILIAPLDWGLGHATRCIPVIQTLLAAGAEVIIAADGPVSSLLHIEFPTVEIIELKGYGIRWTGDKKKIIWLFNEYTRIKKIIKSEHQWLKEIIVKRGITGVISDCRFGLYNKIVPGVFITHQLHIETGSSILNKLARKVNYAYINKFSECWVPDNLIHSLAGKLSHPNIMPHAPVKYIGAISRFFKKEIPIKFDCLFLISGPEPQRSMLENKLLSLNLNNKTIALVRGLPGNNEELNITGISVFNHLSSIELNTLIAKADVIYCRPGYTSVMDLFLSGKKAVFIPTPGQTEQTYLAHHLQKKGLFSYVRQENISDTIFDLKPSPPLSDNKNALAETIRDWLETIRKN